MDIHRDHRTRADDGGGLSLLDDGRPGEPRAGTESVAVVDRSVDVTRGFGEVGLSRSLHLRGPRHGPRAPASAVSPRGRGWPRVSGAGPETTVRQFSASRGTPWGVRL